MNGMNHQLQEFVHSRNPITSRWLQKRFLLGRVNKRLVAPLLDGFAWEEIRSPDPALSQSDSTPHASSSMGSLLRYAHLKSTGNQLLEGALWFIKPFMVMVPLKGKSFSRFSKFPDNS